MLEGYCKVEIYRDSRLNCLVLFCNWIGLVLDWWLLFGPDALCHCSPCILFYPRHYPVPFAQAIVRIRQELIDGRVHHEYPHPMPPGVDTVQRAPTASEGDGLFKAARLGEVVTYLRAGTNLRLPKHWRDGIHWPKAEEWAIYFLLKPSRKWIRDKNRIIQMIIIRFFGISMSKKWEID